MAAAHGRKSTASVLAAKLDCANIATIKEIWEAFVKVAQVVVRAGASVAFEGPKTVPTGSGHE